MKLIQIDCSFNIILFSTKGTDRQVVIIMVQRSSIRLKWCNTMVVLSICSVFTIE